MPTVAFSLDGRLGQYRGAAHPTARNCASCFAGVKCMYPDETFNSKGPRIAKLLIYRGIWVRPKQHPCGIVRQFAAYPRLFLVCVFHAATASTQRGG